MDRSAALACWAAAALGAAGAGEAVKVIDLGGPRQARAEVSAAGDEYAVTVRLLPVRCFDAALNARLNREKARELALLALARHLSGGQAVRLAATGVRVEAVGKDGRFFTLALRVRRQDVSLEEAAAADPGGTPAARDAERVTVRGGLLTRKSDYQDLAAKLVAAVRADVAAAEALAKGEPNGQAFYAAVADIEERGMAWLARLDREVREDILLLEEDQDDLLRLVERKKREALGILAGAVKKYEGQKPRKEKP